MLATLTKITFIKVKYKWTKIEQDSFEEIKWIVARDNLIDFPGFNKRFEIYTDSSDLQL